jgi:DNA processing protein
MTTALTETAALVVLLRSGTHPWSVYAELVAERGSAIAVLEQAGEWDASGQASLLGQTHDMDGLIASAAAEIEGWRSRGMRLLSVLDPDYPENLHGVHDRPPMVFVAGRLQLRDARSIAVIGARAASRRGAAAAREIVAHLIDRGYTVVSGLAAGIDTAAHTEALARQGRTVAVIGTGLRHAYPRENASLQRRIIETGAVISQFWPDAPPRRESFPMRNAVMSGMALGTVVVEASERSGARTQARLALAHGRPVFLLDSLLAQRWARDCAARPGTHVIGCPAELTAAVERLTSAGALTA